jgi:hypothetical protein
MAAGQPQGCNSQHSGCSAAAATLQLSVGSAPLLQCCLAERGSRCSWVHVNKTCWVLIILSYNVAHAYHIGLLSFPASVGLLLTEGVPFCFCVVLRRPFRKCGQCILGAIASLIFRTLQASLHIQLLSCRQSCCGGCACPVSSCAVGELRLAKGERVEGGCSETDNKPLQAGGLTAGRSKETVLCAVLALRMTAAPALPQRNPYKAFRSYIIQAGCQATLIRFLQFPVLTSLDQQ